jgi:predicted dehydrogenase
MQHAPPLTLIQVGIGGFGSSWAEVARQCDGIDLAAVADPSPAARQWAGERLGLTPAQIFASLGDALDAVPAEAVLAITPPDTHHAVVTQALRAGRHVLVEKPLATTIADALDLIATAERQQRALVVSQNYRFRKSARAVQAAVARGNLGELLSVRVDFRRDTRALWPADNFRYRMKHPTVLDMAIHHVDLIRGLTGRNVARVDGRSWPVPDSPYVHHPAVAAIMDLDGGAPVLYHGDWATHDPETSWNGDWVLTGERGRLVWTSDVANPLLGTARFHPWRGEPSELPHDDAMAEDRTGSLLAFARAIRTGEPAETAAQDNIHSLAAVEAWVASIERGHPVDVAALIAHGAP